MRILLVVHGLPPAAAGGTEIYTDLLARTLARNAGDQVLVLAREADPRRPELEERTVEREGHDAVLVNHTFRESRSFADTYRQRGIARLGARLLDRFRPDVAHVQHLTGLGIDLLDELRFRRIPTVLTLNDYWLLCHRGQLLDLDLAMCPGPLPAGCRRCLGIEALGPAARAAGLARRLPRPLLALAQRGAAAMGVGPDAERASARETLARARAVRAALAGVDRFLAPSRTIAARFRDLGIPAERIEQTTQGIDVQPLAGVRRAPSPRLRVGFLGSLMVSKAPHVLLEAAALLPPERVEVHVFGGHAPYHGDDSYRTRLAPLLAAPGVRFHGSVGRERLAQAFAAIDLLVVPSVWLENAPFVIREAFAAGVPALVSDQGGMAEMVEHGVNGLSFRTGDVLDLAHTLKRFHDEPDLLATLRSGLPAVKTVAEDARELRALYTSLAAGVKPVPVRARLAAVVLNHRTPRETILAVRSLEASRRTADQILVVDNGSGDGSVAQLSAALPGATLLESGVNLGFSGGMNLGIRQALAAGAERILLLNSDAWLPPDAIERLEAALELDPRLGITGPVVLMRHDPDRVASLGMRWSATTGRMRQEGFRHLAGTTQPAAREPEGLAGSALLVRREVFERTGLLDEAYFFSFEDLDLCLRARADGFGVAVAAGARVLHAGGATLPHASPLRIYYATRNHLRLAALRSPLPWPLSLARTLAILGYNLAHVLLSAGVPRLAGLSAFARGAADHARGRYGAA